MIYPHKRANILSIILIVLGSIAIFFAIGEFIFRIFLALLGLYLIYNGLILRGNSRFLFFINRFSNLR